MARRWESDVMFLTYLETERLAADAVALVAVAAEELEEPDQDGLEAAFEGRSEDCQ